MKAKGERGWQRIRWLVGITDSMDMNLSKLWETVKDRGAGHAVVHEVAKSWTWLSDWTTTLYGGYYTQFTPKEIEAQLNLW